MWISLKNINVFRISILTEKFIVEKDVHVDDKWNYKVAPIHRKIISSSSFSKPVVTIPTHHLYNYSEAVRQVATTRHVAPSPTSARVNFNNQDHP
jgi:hypothetical protein